MENICFRVLLCTFSGFLLAHFLYFETYHSTFEVLTLKQLRRLSLNRVVPWLTKNHFERDRCWMLKLYHSRCFLMYVFFVFDLVPRIVSPFLACVFVVRFKVSLCSQGNPEEEEHSDHRWNFEAASPKMRCDDFQVISILVSFEFRSAERRVERSKKFHSTQNDVRHSLSNACYLFEPGRISTRLSNCCLFQLTSAQTKHRHVHSFFRLKSLDEYTFLYVHGVWKQVNRFCPVVPRTKSAFAHLPPCKHFIPYRRYQRYAELQKVCLTVPQSCVRCCHTRLEIGYQPHSTTSTFLHSQLLGHGRTWCVFLCSLAQVNSLTTWWASKDVKPGMVVDIWWQSNEISVEGWKPLSGWCADIIRYYTYDLYRFVCLSLKWEPVPVIICILTLDISVSTFIPHHLSLQPSPCALGRMARLGPQSSNGNHLVVVLVVDMSCNFMYKLDSL